MNQLHVLTVRWASRQTRDSMTDLERVIVEYYHKATTDADRLQAEGAAMDLKRYEAIESAVREYKSCTEYVNDRDGDCMICSCHGEPKEHPEWCDYRKAAEALAAALEGSGR